MEEISVVQRIIDTQTSFFQGLLSVARETARSERPNVLDEPSRETHLMPVNQADPRHRSRESTRTRMPAYYLERRTEPSSYYASPSHARSRARSYEREEPSTYYDDGPTYGPPNPRTDFQLASTDPGGYRILFINECLQFLAGRERDFSDFRSWASFLERRVRPFLSLPVLLFLLSSCTDLLTLSSHRTATRLTPPRTGTITLSTPSPS